MHSLKVQQNNSCRVALSFGWTVPQLFAGKSVTRRCWKDSYGQQFIKRWQRGITTYIALDKNWRQGGKQIGWITLTVAPYKERLCEMRYEDVAAEGFPELTRDEFIERFFNGDDQQQVWVIRFRFTPLSEENCSAGIARNLDIAINTENFDSNLGGKSCSAGIAENLDIALDTENVFNSSLEKSCSAGIVSNLDIAIDTENDFRHPVGKNCSAGIAGNLDIALDTENVSTFSGKDCSAGISRNSDIATDTENVFNGSLTDKGCSAGIVPNLDIAIDTDNVNSYPVGKNCSAGIVSNLDIAIDTENDFRHPVGKGCSALEGKKPCEIAVKPSGSELQPIPAEQKIHILAEQHSQAETIKPCKTRDTKPGRGSRPKQTKCNVKRNGQQSKSANIYWLYQFYFKVDGKYYNRSCSIPKEKVKRVIEMWESQQYSWQDIVEYIGKNPDKIVEKARGK